MDECLSHQGGNHFETYSYMINQVALTARQDCIFLLNFFSYGEHQIHFHFSLCGWVRTRDSPRSQFPQQQCLLLFPYLRRCTGRQQELNLIYDFRKLPRTSWLPDPSLGITVVECPHFSQPGAPVPWRAKYDIDLEICFCQGRKKGRLPRARSLPGPRPSVLQPQQETCWFSEDSEAITTLLEVIILPINKSKPNLECAEKKRQRQRI